MWLTILSGCLLNTGDQGAFADRDGDGFEAGEVGGIDCDDSSGDVNPLAAEVCDGFDNNCDGQIDAIDNQPIVIYLDADADGVGTPQATACSEAIAAGLLFTTNPGPDCDDNNPNVGLGSQEIACNGVDDDCDGFTAHFTITDELGEQRFFERSQLNKAFSSLRSFETLELCERQEYFGPVEPFGQGVVSAFIEGAGSTISLKPQDTCVAAFTIQNAGKIGVATYGGAGYGGPIPQGIANNALTISDLHFNRTPYCDSPYIIISPVQFIESQVILSGIYIQGDDPPQAGDAPVYPSAYYGGGMSAMRSVLHIKDSFFYRLYAAYSGGAITAIDSTVIFEGGQFLGNAAGLTGGAIDLLNAQIEVNGPASCPTAFNTPCDASQPMFINNQLLQGNPRNEAFYLIKSLISLHSSVSLDDSDRTTWGMEGEGVNLSEVCSGGWCVCQHGGGTGECVANQPSSTVYAEF